jgi:phosphohistidine phosphatase
MEIYLLRHGIAESARPGLPDAQRALTEEGREKLLRVLKRARAAGVRPNAILSSPYQRALETAALAARALGFDGPIERTRALEPSASPGDAWEAIRLRPVESALLLSSHEPLTSVLTAYLLNCPALKVDMKKAGLLRVDCDRLGPRPHGELKWLLTPATA